MENDAGPSAVVAATTGESLTAISPDDDTATTTTGNSLAPFNPSSDQAVDVALGLMDLTADDILFDIGCGDARVLKRAVQETPVRCCIGIDIDPKCVARAVEHQPLLAETVRERLEIRCGDVWQDASKHSVMSSPPSSICAGMRLDRDCTVLYVYLLPRGLRQLQPLLDQLVVESKLRAVVAYMFSIRPWTPTRGESWCLSACLPVCLPACRSNSHPTTRVALFQWIGRAKVVRQCISTHFPTALPAQGIP